MKVYNPTENEIEVQIKGVTYKVGAGAEISNVPADAAEYWRTMLHPFLTVSEDDKRVIEVEVMPEVTHSREEVVAELGEETVKEIEDSAEEVEIVVKPKKAAPKKK